MSIKGGGIDSGEIIPVFYEDYDDKINKGAVNNLLQLLN